MASIDTSRVTEDIKKLIGISQGLKKLVKATLEQIRDDPGSFDLLDSVSPEITNRYRNLATQSEDHQRAA